MPRVIIGLDALPAEIQRQIEQVADIARESSVEVAARGEIEAVRLVDEKGLVDLGHYKRSFFHRQRSDGAHLWNSASYASDLEWGRRPGRPGPPFSAIFGWVGRKLGLTGEDQKRAAWAIRNKIRRYGTKPHHVLLTVSKRAARWWRQDIVRRWNSRIR